MPCSNRTFLSTPSARRATFSEISGKQLKYISIHALREEGDMKNTIDKSYYTDISIHALREEGDV